MSRRFALGLNFGTGAFNGDQRWVQVEFRNPAGTGQYLTLAPRDKILAAPYALYALNSTASQWDYNPKTQALTSAQNVAKVGIGTNAPTAALEVVAAGGDDAVKLPAGSIGLTEFSGTTCAVKDLAFSWHAGEPTEIAWSVSIPASGYILIQGAGMPRNAGPKLVRLDGVGLGDVLGPTPTTPYQSWVFLKVVPVNAGVHVLSATVGTYSSEIPPDSCAGHFSMLFTRDALAP